MGIDNHPPKPTTRWFPPPSTFLSRRSAQSASIATSPTRTNVSTPAGESPRVLITVSEDVSRDKWLCHRLVSDPTRRPATWCHPDTRLSSSTTSVMSTFSSCTTRPSLPRFRTPFRRERELRLLHARRSSVLRLPTQRPESRSRFRLVVFRLGTLHGARDCGLS